MSRPVTLVTAQWADLPLEVLAAKAKEMGYDGLELVCSGDHFEVDKALEDDAYLPAKRALLEKHGLQCYALAAHAVGQCVCDPIDARHQRILPERLWQDGDPEGVRQRAAVEMQHTAQAAARFGVRIVNGFTGSSVWARLYFYPPTRQPDVDAGFQDFAARWRPILDVFQAEGVRFALEVHPTEIAYDLYTAQRALAALDQHPAFGFNFDPSHLVPQFVDPVAFLHEFPTRIFHVHVKDARVHLDGRSSILGSHLSFGDARRGWDFVSPGRGDVKWDLVVRALNRIGYQGPLSVEWEDSGMDREWGAREALAFVRTQDFTASAVAFDAAFSRTAPAAGKD